MLSNAIDFLFGIVSDLLDSLQSMTISGSVTLFGVLIGAFVVAYLISIIFSK